MYSLATREQVQTLGQQGGLLAAAFTPEPGGGSSLATLGKGGKLRLWDPESGLCRYARSNYMILVTAPG